MQRKIWRLIRMILTKPTDRSENSPLILSTNRVAAWLPGVKKLLPTQNCLSMLQINVK